MLRRLVSLIATSFRLALLFAVASGLYAAGGSARLNSTFLQLTPEHKRWTEAQWSALFNCFQQLQLSEVIVQWTAYDDMRFYPGPGEGSDALLERILSGASKIGLKVWLGLYLDPDYWNRISGDPAATAAYLARLRSRSLAIAHDLTPLVKRQSTFIGWYLPEEIDDLNWRSPEARQELLRHLSLESTSLHALTPGARVALSTFSDASVSPAEFRDFWTEALHTSAINVLFLQDGIGARKLELNEFPLYADALAQATHSTGRDFAVVVELFEQTGGPPVTNGPFQASAAAWERVRNQLEIAHRFANSIAGFSVPEYMNPSGTSGAEKLYKDYLKGSTQQ